MDDTTHEVPLCTRCLQPVRAVDYYCPRCGQATGQFTAYLPFVDIPFLADFVAAWWKRATGPGVSWWLRIPMLVVLVLEAPILVVICIFAWPWRRRRRRRQNAAS